MSRRKPATWTDRNLPEEFQGASSNSNGSGNQKRPRREPRGTAGRRKPAKLSPSRIRIVSGEWRNQKIKYNGDPATRPMKEKTREAVFSLLGGKLGDTFTIDLFAGTAILAIEAISRGSVGAVALELSRPAVRTIIDNLHRLGMDERVKVHNVDTLRWLRSIGTSATSWPEYPWVVFCCPPYRLWEEQSERLCAGLSEMFKIAPPGSQFVCESDQQYDLVANMPHIEWDIRSYPPASVGLARKYE
jgi:16S rRNA (guanine966-N2)-methyltransferase